MILVWRLSCQSTWIHAYPDGLFQVAPAIKGKMQLRGSMMIGYQPQGNFVNFFRMICANPMNTKEDMDHILNIIQEYGEEP